MMPPCEFLDSKTATECGPAFVCLNEARVAPVWMSWTAINPGPPADVAGAVAQSTVSRRSMAIGGSEH